MFVLCVAVMQVFMSCHVCSVCCSDASVHVMFALCCCDASVHVVFALCVAVVHADDIKNITGYEITKAGIGRHGVSTCF